MKRIFAMLLCILLALSLCGCQESTEDKIARLEKEAAAAKQKAREAQANVNFLESILGK